MGKKNRRKKVDKKERKERLQERRERLNETVDRPVEEGEDQQETGGIGDPLVVGQRVYYARDEMDITVWQSAIIKDASQCGTARALLPVEAQDNPDSWLSVSAKEVFVDNEKWTLRFKEGDKVLCWINQRWTAATVSGIWPFGLSATSYSYRPPYHCTRQEPLAGENGAYIAVPMGSPDLIVKCPQTFRFLVGDDVIIATATAVGLSKQSRSTPWIPAKIMRVDIVGLQNYYAVYECSYTDQKRARICHVLEDSDEHVASPSATTRERLFDAIANDCGYDHLDTLIKTSDMDVIAFRDLLVSKAIESGSYNALLWLQENAEVTLTLVRDAENNGLFRRPRMPHDFLRLRLGWLG